MMMMPSSVSEPKATGWFCRRTATLIVLGCGDLALWLTLLLGGLGALVWLDWEALAHLFLPPKHMSLRLQDAYSITKGATVRLMGVPVGEVDALTPGPQGVILSFHLEPNMPPIPLGSKAHIVAYGLGGNKSLDFDLPTALETAPANPSVTRMNDQNYDVQEPLRIKASFNYQRNIGKTLQEGAKSLNEALGDQSAAEQRQTIKHWVAAVHQQQQALAQFDALFTRQVAGVHSSSQHFARQLHYQGEHTLPPWVALSHQLAHWNHTLPLGQLSQAQHALERGHQQLGALQANVAKVQKALAHVKAPLTTEPLPPTPQGAPPPVGVAAPPAPQEPTPLPAGAATPSPPPSTAPPAGAKPTGAGVTGP